MANATKVKRVSKIAAKLKAIRAAVELVENEVEARLERTAAQITEFAPVIKADEHEQTKVN